MKLNSESIKNKLFESNFGLSESFAENMSQRLLDCDDVLKPNIAEWLEGKPFSDIYIHDKYCLNMILKIRGNPTSALDTAKAILALNNYAADKEKEYQLWQKRM